MPAAAAFALALFNAIAAIPVILGYVKDFASGVMMWYVQNSQNETLKQIADAAALSARAKTTEDRYAAAQAWQSALSRNRVS